MDSLASHRHSSMRRRCHVRDIQEAVRERYAAKALQMADSSSCCGTSCCSDTGCGEGYTAQELASVGIDPTASLGCGNPTLLADLRPGERVLDLGSGAGLDVLLSARRGGPGGGALRRGQGRGGNGGGGG